MTKKNTFHKSSKTGKFVTESYAKKNPDTTYRSSKKSNNSKNK